MVIIKMTEKKRFTLREPRVDNTIGCSEISDNGEWITYGEIVELLNELYNENQLLKKHIRELYNYVKIDVDNKIEVYPETLLKGIINILKKIGDIE